MAVYRTTITFHKTTGIPEDDVVNTWHFDTGQAFPTNDVASALNGHVAASYNDAAQGGGAGAKLLSFYGPQVSRAVLPTVKTYSEELGGSPLAVDTMLAMPAAVGGIALPDEVAAVLSFHADLAGVPEEQPDGADAGVGVDRLRSRRRGRVFLGPFGDNAITGNPARIHGNLGSAMVDLAVRMGNITNAVLTNGAVDAKWVVWSKKDGVPRNVVGGWRDDAFDTIRKRGVAPLARSIFAIVQ